MTRYSKFIAAALAFVGVIVASGLLHGQAQAWASCILSAIGAALVYLVPNMPKPPKRNERGAVDLDEMGRLFEERSRNLEGLAKMTTRAIYGKGSERGASDVYVLVVVVLLVLILLAVAGVI